MGERTRRRVGLALLALGLCLGAQGACGRDPLPAAPEEGVAPPLSPRAAALRRAAERWRTRSQRLRQRAAGFEADAALRALPRNPRSGPVFRFDEQLARARLDAAAPARRAEPLRSFGFELDADPPGLLPVAGDFRVRDGTLGFRHRRDRHLASQRPLELDRDAIGAIELRMKVMRGRRASLAWRSQPVEPGASWREIVSGSGGVITLDLVPDGRFHVYRIDARTALRGPEEAGSKLAGIYLRASDVDGDPVEIDFLRLVPRRGAYAGAVAGRAYETLGREMRSVLYLRAPATLRWSVRVPADDPRLSFGTGVLEADAPVRFAVSVTADAAPREVYARSVSDADRWSDAEVDLSPWAGREVEIGLSAQSGAGNVAFWSNPLLSGAPPDPLHVIVLLEDTLRADHLAAYGHVRETSPARDALARRGVLFERAYAQATKTRPSCPSFMTSLLPSATGVWDHSWRLDERFLTLAEILRSQGFETAAFTQNANAGHAAGLHQGFGQVFDRSLLGEGPEIFGAPVRAWVEAHRHRNFFLYVHAIDPHGVYDPPPPFDAWYRAAGPGATPTALDRLRFDPPWLETPSVEGRRLLYDGEILHNDSHLGSLLDALDAMGILDRALVVLTSDHGEHLGEHGLFGHNAPGYAQVLRVPLVLAHPSLPAGRRVEQPAQLLDLMPTVLELAGVERRSLLLQGDSLLGLLRDPAGFGERVVVSEEPTLFGSRSRPRRSGSLFFRDLHLLRSAALEGPRAFDVGRDPQESGPLAEADTAELQQLAAALLDELRADGLALRQAIAPGGDAEIAVDPGSREQLRALGYVE